MKSIQLLQASAVAAVLLATGMPSANADTLCNRSVIGAGIDAWQPGQYLYNCLTSAGTAQRIVVPAQPAAYRVDVSWGGHDKSNGTPGGDIQLIVGTQERRHTTARHHPESGDDNQTWRWDGTESFVVPAKERRSFTVLHDTTNGQAGNTYLRIRLLSAD